MKVLITGHLGFVGMHLAPALRMRGNTVIGYDLRNGYDILRCPLPDVDLVFHLAAQTNAQSHDVFHDAQTNVMGTVRILQRYGSIVVFASTSMANHPVCAYGISKRACEDYVKYFGAAIVRFCNLHGLGGHSVIDRFNTDAVITIRGSGQQRRTYAHVSAAVDMLMNAKPGHTSILSGQDMTVNEIAALHPNKSVRYVPSSATDLMEVMQ